MVTDKDREAAAAIYAQVEPDTFIGSEEGIQYMAELISAHREAAIAERDAQLVKWLERLEEGNQGTLKAAHVRDVRERIEAKEPWK